MACRAMACHAAPCHAMPRRAMLCHALHMSSTRLRLATCPPIYPPAALAVCSHPLQAACQCCSTRALCFGAWSWCAALCCGGPRASRYALSKFFFLSVFLSRYVRASRYTLGRLPCHCCLLPAAGVFMARYTCAAASSSSKPACQAARLPWHPAVHVLCLYGSSAMQAVMIYAPEAADLLDPAAWRASMPAAFDRRGLLLSAGWSPYPLLCRWGCCSAAVGVAPRPSLLAVCRDCFYHSSCAFCFMIS